MVSVVASPPAFSISALTPSAPGAFPNVMPSIADFKSAADGGSMLTRFVSFRDVCYAYKICASLLRMVSTCVIYSFICFSTLVTSTPSACFILCSLICFFFTFLSLIYFSCVCFYPIFFFLDPMSFLLVSHSTFETVRCSLVVPLAIIWGSD